MKRSILPILSLAVALCGCTMLKSPITSAQALAIGTPITYGAVGLVLRNNPSYIPVAQRVGADLAKANYSDLTLLGITAAVGAAVDKEGGDATLKAIITSTVEAGLAGYLEAVSESALSNDPNAVLVLQAFGQAVTDGAALASANPK